MTARVGAVSGKAAAEVATGRRALESRARLPVLADDHARLRGLRQSDAGSLLFHLSKPSVVQHGGRCPASLAGMQRFVRWTQAERRRGLLLTFGIVPSGLASPVGLVQIWTVERDFSTAEWGVVIGDAYWGTKVFASTARLVFDFAFDALGVIRLEARVVEGDERGAGSLRKLGAVREGVLRQGYRHGDVVKNHVMWSILAHEWAAKRDAGRHGRRLELPV